MRKAKPQTLIPHSPRTACETQAGGANASKPQTLTPTLPQRRHRGREKSHLAPSPWGGGQGEGESGEGLKLGLVGWPLGHSLSPRLHNAALAALILPGEYRLYPVAPFPEGQARLAELLDHVRSGALHGLNVTIPHKQNVLPLLDDLTPTAAAIGAANLIFLKAGRLTGDNADAAGFLADLQSNGLAQPASGSRIALVLGAGGSTRAVVYALANAGWQVWIAARRIEQANTLAASLHITGPALNVLRLEPESLTGPYDLIVNTTPLGMHPDVETCPWPAGLPFPSWAGVYDLVYNPFETTFVRRARAAGLHAANGLGMLVNQAAIAFETWTGQPAPLAAMWAAVAQQKETTQP
jgi:shikimate dehydrogenase